MRPALLILTLLFTSTWAQKLSKYAPDVVGLYTLPKIDRGRLPPQCGDFKAACAAERAGDFDTAFRLYEDKYDNCSDVGWTDFGHKHGSADSVTMKTTPCNTLKTAVKGLRRTKECDILRLLTTGDAAHECPGCFPQYYYYSNKTRACYSEFIPAVPVTRFMAPHRNYTLQQMRVVRVLFQQGVRAVQTLRA